MSLVPYSILCTTGKEMYLVPKTEHKTCCPAMFYNYPFYSALCTHTATSAFIQKNSVTVLCADSAASGQEVFLSVGPWMACVCVDVLQTHMKRTMSCCAPSPWRS